MMQHLETNNIFYELQRGFRAKRSCESQIISLIHDLSQNNDKNIQTDGTLPVSNDLVNNNVKMSVHISIFSFSTLPAMVSGPVASEGTLHSHPSEKANILSKQFQSAFTSEANTIIPDKGPCFLYIASMSFSFRSGAWL
jgi:hypothetical protein